MAVTPLPGLVTSIVTGGTAVQVFPANISGGFITNPPTASETLYINPINAATLSATVNTFALLPGQTWTVIPGQTSPTTANATTSGHAFSAVYWV